MKLKQKDIIALLAAVTIFVVTGVLLFTLMGQKKGSSGGAKVATTEVVIPISSEFSEDGQKALTDPTISRDYTQPIDLSTGLGNSQLFGPY